jgi:hypothetical protein
LYKSSTAVDCISLLSEHFCNVATNNEKEQFKKTIEKLKNEPERAYLYM